MKIINLHHQSFLISNGIDSVTLKNGVNKAPEWVANNSYAKRLKKEGKIFFEHKANNLEILKKQAVERNIPIGEHITEEQLKELLNGKKEI